MKLSVANKASITTGPIVNKVDFNHKKAQNTSLTSLYTVDSDHDTKLLKKMNPKDWAILETLKNQTIWLAKKIRGQGLSTWLFNYLNNWINSLPLWMSMHMHKSALSLHSVLTYCRFSNRNYFWHGQYLTTHMWM